jgi:hypothetical protein
MNERIKELAQQAQEYAGQQIDEGANWDDAPIYYTDKLAELIVAECANVADDNYIHRGSRTCGLAIRLHFGVEE